MAVLLTLMAVAMAFLAGAQYARTVRRDRALTNLLVVGGVITGIAWIGWVWLYLP